MEMAGEEAAPRRRLEGRDQCLRHRSPAAQAQQEGGETFAVVDGQAC